MIKKNKTWRRNLKTERGDTEGVGPQLQLHRKAGQGQTAMKVICCYSCVPVDMMGSELPGKLIYSEDDFVSWFDYQEESFSYKVQLKKFCLPT